MLNQQIFELEDLEGKSNQLIPICAILNQHESAMENEKKRDAKLIELMKNKMLTDLNQFSLYYLLQSIFKHEFQLINPEPALDSKKNSNSIFAKSLINA